MNPRAPSAPFPILFEDRHLLVVFKTPGWIVQGARDSDPSMVRSVADWIRRRDEKPGKAFLAVVHRLDRPVSGIVVLAKRSKAASRLSDQIRGRRFQKRYRAVVEGLPDPERGELRDLLGWDDAKRRARVGDRRGKPAELRYETISATGTRSLLDVELITGRKHQIRAQLAAHGTPIAGDRHYGAESEAGAEGGIALLAHSVRFRHPVEEREVELSVPADLDPLPAWLRG